MTITKAERERNSRLLVATLNYLLAHHAHDLVYDDEYSPSKNWYLQEMAQTEKDIESYKHKAIKKRLDLHTSMLRHRYDQGLNTYLKAHTGYAFDLFEAYKNEIIPLLAKSKIDGNDVYPIEKYLKAYGAVPEERQNVAILKALLAKHQAKMARLANRSDVITESFYLVTEGSKSHTLNEAQYQEYVKKNQKKWLLSETTSPNGRNTLFVKFNGRGEQALTYVSVKIGEHEGPVFSINAEKLPINAYWKNDGLVVIESSATYEVIHKYSKISSYGEVVHIEYQFC